MPNLMTRIARDFHAAFPTLSRFVRIAQRERVFSIQRRDNETTIGFHPLRLYSRDHADCQVGVRFVRHWPTAARRYGWCAAVYARGEDDASLWVVLPRIGFCSLTVKLPGSLPKPIAERITRAPLRSTVEIGAWVGRFAVGEDYHIQIDLGNPSHGRYDPDKPWYWQRPIYLEIDPRFWLFGRKVVQKLSAITEDAVVTLPDGAYPCRIELTHYRRVRRDLARFTWAGETYWAAETCFVNRAVPVGAGRFMTAVGVPAKTVEKAVGLTISEILRWRKQNGWQPDPPADSQLKLPLKN